MKRSDTKPSPGGEGLATAVSDSPSGSNHSFAKSVRALHTSAQHAQELTEVTFMSDKAFNRKYPEEDRAHIAIARDAKEEFW